MIASVYELEPSLTYCRRDAVWLPAGQGWYSDHRDGTLTITLQHSRRTHAKVESDTYAVERQPTLLAIPVPAVFLLANLTDPEQAEVYQTVIAGRPEDDQCTCTAGRVRHYRCKHADSLRAVVEDYDPNP